MRWAAPTCMSVIETSLCGGDGLTVNVYSRFSPPARASITFNSSGFELTTDTNFRFPNSFWA